jgi:hypothetical protein
MAALNLLADKGLSDDSCAAEEKTIVAGEPGRLSQRSAVAVDGLD